LNLKTRNLSQVPACLNNKIRQIALKSPLVTIIIPTFNRPVPLKRALKSALNQTYGNVEITVINDCPELSLNTLEKEFSSVRFLNNKKNKGACYSRNRGLNIAKGEYVNFLDDDDELYPKKIELQVKKFLNSNDPRLGMVTAHALDLRSGVKKIKKNSVSGDMYRKLLSSYAISGTESMLFKKSSLLEIGGFDENLQSSQEYDLLIRFAEKFTVDFVDEILSRENRSTGQISLNFDKKIQGAKYLYKKHDSRFRSEGFLLWLCNRIKVKVLLARYYVGKWFGEKTYRMMGVK